MGLYWTKSRHWIDCKPSWRRSRERNERLERSAKHICHIADNAQLVNWFLIGISCNRPTPGHRWSLYQNNVVATHNNVPPITTFCNVVHCRGHLCVHCRFNTNCDRKYKRFSYYMFKLWDFWPSQKAKLISTSLDNVIVYTIIASIKNTYIIIA